MQTKTYNTPIGRLASDLINEVKGVAGFEWDKEYKDWVLISNKCTGKRVNPNGNRKANEDHLIKSDMWLPLRYYNFLYALHQCAGDIKKTIKYAKEKLEELDGEPVYLPDLLAIKTGDQNMSYTKIMNLVVRKKQI